MGKKPLLTTSETKRLIQDFYRILLYGESPFAVSSSYFEDKFGVNRSFVSQLLARELGNGKWDIFDRLKQKPHNREILRKIGELVKDFDLDDPELDASIKNI